MMKVKKEGSRTLLRCGDCLHFAGTKHPDYESICSKRGITAGASAPMACYSPDVHVFRRHGPEFFTALAVLTAAMNAREVRVLFGMLTSAAHLKKKGQTLFAKAYICINNGKYLSDYYSGYILGRGTDGTTLLLGKSVLDKHKPPMVAQAMNVLTPAEFRKKKEELKQAGRINNPHTKRRYIPITPAKLDSYEPPSIDTSKQELENRAAGKGRKRTGSANVTLDIASSTNDDTGE